MIDAHARTQARAIGQMNEAERPKVFVSASAVGYYPTGVPGPEVDEDHAPRADSWFGELTEAWEGAADEAAHAVRASDASRECRWRVCVCVCGL
jgi:NAD dependent epimerase/dehydratase family enzyme